MLHVECRTINHFSRLDKRIKIEITSYSYNFEIVVYSFFDKKHFSFSNKPKLQLKHFSFFVHGFRFLLLCKILFQSHWMLPVVEHEKLFEMFPFLCVSLNFSISRDGSLNIPPRWHQMLQPSLFSIPFPKFEGNLRLSIWKSREASGASKFPFPFEAPIRD